MKGRVSLGQINGVESIDSGSNTPSVLARSLFYYLESYGHWLCSAQYNTVREGLSSILALYTLSGEGELYYRGNHYTLTRGDIFIIDCTEYQQYRTTAGKAWEFLYIHFYGQESRLYLKNILQYGGAVYRCAEDDPVPKSMWEIVSLTKQKGPHTDVYASLMLVNLLSEFLILSRAEKLPEASVSEAMLQSIRYIEEHYREPLDLERLSKQVKVSKYYLCHQFKKQTGFSPYEYYVNFKVNQSKELLKYTDLRVGEISDYLCFTDMSHFIKTFTYHEKITPLKYRKIYRG